MANAHRVPEPGIAVFDQRAVRRHRTRAAAAGYCADFLFAEGAELLADRLDDINRRFPSALDLGCRDGILARHLGGRGDIEHLVTADGTAAFAPNVVAEAEALPFVPRAFDLVLSNLALHWTNDLPGALLQLRHVLKPDGLLLASLFAGLLQRAGFALPVVDSDRIEASYGDALALMRDLRHMGESNALVLRRRTVARRATLFRAAAIYAARFAGADGRIPARFEIATLTAWAPADSQPRPLRPGSATARLADALGTKEHKSGDEPAP